MYIVPQTDVRLLKGVPLENSYHETMYFTSSSAQYNAFNSFPQVPFSEFTYNRANRGHIKVGVSADSIFDCNYMMFKNRAYSNKWFYAFINAIDYVNDNCADITFEIDDMQTWLFDYELQEVFVEREHTRSDKYFEHIVPENLDTGEYIVRGFQERTLHPLAACFITSRTANGQTVEPKMYNGVYTPVNIIKGYNLDEQDSINALTNAVREFIAAGQENAILTAYEYPLEFGFVDSVTPDTEPISKDTLLATNIQTIDGYTPKNKKLFTYPYNFLLASNNCGNTCEYRYELFSHEEETTITNFNPEVRLTGVAVTTPCVMMYPKNYRGLNLDFDSGMVISNFPMIPTVGDTYKAYMAQAKGNIVGSTLSSTISGALSGGTAGTMAGGLAGAAVGAIGGAAVGALSQVGTQVGAKIRAEATPPQVKGQVQTESLNAGMRRYKFSFYRMQIQAPFAKIIDEYFSRYGYKVNRVKVPNRNNRQRYTFIKTIGCSLTGRMPADAAKHICQIFDNGVTFWKNIKEVGDYSLDNAPLE